MSDEINFQPLLDYLTKLPGMDSSIGSGADETLAWWVKFHIAIDHPLA